MRVSGAADFDDVSPEMTIRWRPVAHGVTTFARVARGRHADHRLQDAQARAAVGEDAAPAEEGVRARLPAVAGARVELFFFFAT